MRLATGYQFSRPRLTRILESLDLAAFDACIAMVGETDSTVVKERHDQKADITLVVVYLKALADQGHLELSLEE